MRSLTRRTGALLIITFLSLGCGGEGGADGAAAVRADGTAMSEADRAAAASVRSRLEEHWTKAPDGWTTEYELRNMMSQPMAGVPDLLYRQYRSFDFTIAPEQLTEAQRLNGADYRASVRFATTPERQYRTRATFEGPQGWSSWRDASPTFTLTVERRGGQWLISDDALFDGIKADPANVPASN